MLGASRFLILSVPNRQDAQAIEGSTMIFVATRAFRLWPGRAFWIPLFVLLGSVPVVARPASAAGLLWSTYLGGTGVETPHGVAVDAAGNIYVAGTTASGDFPVTGGVIQPGPATPTDVVVTKLRADGTTIVWSTYLGGSQSEDGRAIAVDASGNVYVTGNTRSPDFPVTPGAFRTTYGGGISDAFVAKISPDGRQLLYSTFLGGDWDDYPRAIAVDGSGNAYVAGSTNSLDFPVTAGVVKSVRNPTIYDGADGFVSKLNPSGSALVWSTYLGSGGGTDNIFGLALDGQDRPTLVGWTLSPGYPTTANAFDRTFDNRREGFVTRLNATASGYVYSTFIGAEGHDECLAVAVDATGAAYVTGRTESTAFPVTGDAVQASFGGGTDDAFLLALSPAGDALEFSTYLGGPGSDTGHGVAVIGTKAVVTGTTDGGFPASGDTQYAPSGAGPDCFVTSIAGASLVYSSCLGGDAAEDGLSVAVDGSGRAVVIGSTASSGFPTTSGAYDPTYSGNGDDFVSVVDVGDGGTLAVGAPITPSTVSFSPAWPNPSRATTIFRFMLPNPARVVLTVRDPQGRLVTTLCDNAFDAGLHEVVWQGNGQAGTAVTPGVYFAVLRAAGSHAVQEVVRLR